jgi:hypothetical protein
VKCLDDLAAADAQARVGDRRADDRRGGAREVAGGQRGRAGPGNGVESQAPLSAGPGPPLSPAGGHFQDSALTKTCIDPAAGRADDPAMRSHPILARWAAGALSTLLVVSSLACMTVVCRDACGSAASPRTTSAGEVAVPPCHGGGDPATTPADEGACGTRMVCCSTWHDDAKNIVLPAPGTLAGPLSFSQPALLPVPPALPRPANLRPGLLADDPLGSALPPVISSRSSRAPPETPSAA